MGTIGSLILYKSLPYEYLKIGELRRLLTTPVSQQFPPE